MTKVRNSARDAASRARRLAHGAAVVGVLAVAQGAFAALDGQAPVWRVSATPTLSISGAPGRGGEFEKVYDALRLANGSIVAADRAHRLVLFASDGRFLRAIGREGNGPGEFANGPLWVQSIAGDTILTFEFGNGHRLTYFTSEGDYVRSVTGGARSQAWYRGALADGSLVGTIMDACAVSPPFPGCPPPPALPQRPREVRVLRGWVGVLRADSQGRATDTLGFFPQADEIVVPGLPSTMAGAPDALLRDTHVATGRDRVYVSTGETFRVAVLSMRGDTIGLIERPHALRRVTQEDLSARVVESFPRRAEERLRGVDWTIPDDQTAPAILDMVVAESGELWIEEGRQDARAAGTWHVYRGLRHVATVEVPPSFRPRHIDAQSIVGVWTDELDVDWVQERALTGSGR